MKRSIKSLLATLVVSLSLAAPVLAGPWEDGEAAYRRGDYAIALRLFRPLAEQGDANAQYVLGLMYAKGKGVPLDFAAAMKWYRKAAKQGDAGAQSLIGTMYYHGKGVPQNYAKAVAWYRKAAELGYAKAQFFLGAVYNQGKGVPQDYVEAHKWYNLAAAQGFKNAAKVRKLLAKGMTPTQIAEAQRLAREWKPKK